MKDTSKLRLILICQLLMGESDAEHPLTIVKIRQILKERYDIDANRNTVTDDLNTLKAHGFPLEAWRSRQNRYYYNGRPFETAELKLLIDAVAASKFITERKSRDLIGKLTKLTTKAEAEQLNRHIYVDARPKTDNESGYYIVDAVNEAIETGRRISFQYTDYDAAGAIVLRHGGRIYILSPYALLWDGDYYYTIGWLDPPGKITTAPDDDSVSDQQEGSLRTFRLDRIAQQPTILDEPAIPAPEDFDIGAFRKSVFRMYSTDKPEEVTLLCDNHVMRAIIDNFGSDVHTDIVDEDHFLAIVTVYPSPTFYRWVFGWGWDGSIVIVGPENVKAQYRKMLRKADQEEKKAESPETLAKRVERTEKLAERLEDSAVGSTVEISEMAGAADQLQNSDAKMAE